MARKNKIDKINDLEEQIKKMQEEKIKLVEKLERDIGKMITKEWGSYDLNAITEFAKSISEQARNFINENEGYNEEIHEETNI